MNIYQISTNETYIIDILNVTKETIVSALDTDFKDFEDAVQYCVADMNRMEMIVTRNKSDFQNSEIDVCTPDELIEKLTEK